MEMVVNGERVSQDQITAGLSAMIGNFTSGTVRGALARSGVMNTDRAADRLLQSERKAGRIRAVNNKNWERLA